MIAKEILEIISKHWCSNQDIMRIAKDMALIGLGAVMVLAYQRYNEPVMEMVEEAYCNAKKKANQALDNMK